MKFKKKILNIKKLLKEKKKEWASNQKDKNGGTKSDKLKKIKRG